MFIKETNVPRYCSKGWLLASYCDFRRRLLVAPILFHSTTQRDNGCQWRLHFIPLATINLLLLRRDDSCHIMWRKDYLSPQEASIVDEMRCETKGRSTRMLISLLFATSSALFDRYTILKIILYNTVWRAGFLAWWYGHSRRSLLPLSMCFCLLWISPSLCNIHGWWGTYHSTFYRDEEKECANS